MGSIMMTMRTLSPLGIFILLELSLESVKLFNDDQELQEYEARKVENSAEAVSRRQLEASLTRLNSLLGRPSDISKILLDSEESAEVFRLRHYQRSRRSPKRSKEKKSKEKKGKKKKRSKESKSQEKKKKKYGESS